MAQVECGLFFFGCRPSALQALSPRTLEAGALLAVVRHAYTA